MKLSPRAPAEGINTPSDNTFKVISGLIIGAIFIVGVFFVVISAVVDFVVDQLDPATEVALFDDMVPAMLEAFGEEGFDEAAEAVIAPIFERVRASGPDLPYDFTVRVACERSPNALALPGGGVIVTSGLLNIIDTEEELIFILGHELGHFVHRDHLRGMGRSVALQLAMGGMLVTTGIDPTIGLQLALEAMSSAHSREQEIAADETGLKVLHSLHPEDVSGAKRALNGLHEKLERGSLDSLDFWRSHPLGPKRIEALSARIQSEGLTHAKLRGTPLPEALQRACSRGRSNDQPEVPHSTAPTQEQGDADVPADPAPGAP
jgi:beta-barrel assembly-enhancing protease